MRRVNTKTILQAADVIAEMLWPTRCAICDVPGDLLCQNCRSKLLFIDRCTACRKCGAPFGYIQCTECNQTILSSNNRDCIPFNEMAHALILDENARRMVSTYKDKGDRRLANEIASYMVRYINPAWTEHNCAITFIPATKAAMRRRGFDHAEEIAMQVSKMIGISCIPLFRRPCSNDQRTLTRKQRFKNMSEQISLVKGLDIPQSVIVLDDVCTTGSTLYAAADSLRNAHVSYVYALTFGRVI